MRQLIGDVSRIWTDRQSKIIFAKLQVKERVIFQRQVKVFCRKYNANNHSLKYLLLSLILNGKELPAMRHIRKINSTRGIVQPSAVDSQHRRNCRENNFHPIGKLLLTGSVAQRQNTWENIQKISK